jgi:hypothetical protein
LAALECLWKSISLVLIHPFFQILLSCPWQLNSSKKCLVDEST